VIGIAKDRSNQRSVIGGSKQQADSSEQETGTASILTVPARCYLLFVLITDEWSLITGYTPKKAA